MAALPILSAIFNLTGVTRLRRPGLTFLGRLLAKPDSYRLPNGDCRCAGDCRSACPDWRYGRLPREEVMSGERLG